MAFDIRPWAQIERVTAKSGAAVSVQCPATPCVVPLPPGEYHVVARNPFLKSPLEFDLVVPQAVYFAVSRPMPDFAPDAEARRMLDEGVAQAPMDLDLAMITGAGFQFWNGGLTPLLDREGVSEKVTGQRFLPPGVASVPA